MNKWNIPEELEALVLDRDTSCVYCGIVFADSSTARRDQPSWEHIINDASIVTEWNIARCCIGCNASKGAKPLLIWFTSSYCIRRGISPATVSQVVREHLLHVSTLNRT